MYTLGNNTFSVRVADISGNAVTGIASGWSVIGEVAGNTIDTIVSSAEAAVSGGWYNHVVSLPLGQGFIEILNSNTNYLMDGAFEIDNVNVYSIDDIYSSISRVTGEITSEQITSFELITSGPHKIGADVEFVYIVPASVTTVPLSGFTDLSIQLRTDVALISGGVNTGYLGDGTITITDTDTMSVLIPGSMTSGSQVLTSGMVDGYIFADIAGTDPYGKRKVLAELDLIMRRNFNR